jgi:hypothetical protein
MKNLTISLLVPVFSMNLVTAQKAVLSTYAERSNLKGQIKSIKWDKDFLDELDKEGNLTATTYFKEDGSIESTVKYKYAKPGLVTEISTYDASNKLKDKTICEYDKNDNKITSTTYDSENKITYQEITKYTDSHHYTTDLINKGKTHKILTVTTDKSGNIIEEIATTDGKTYAVYVKRTLSYKPGMSYPYLTQHFDKDGKVTIEIQDDFDNKGNVVKHVEKGYGQTQTTTYEYSYDAKGNYTKQVAKGYEHGTYERTITYY